MAKKKNKQQRQAAAQADGIKTQPCKRMPRGLKKPPETGEERFLLERLLGAGGVCEVHAALDLRRVEMGDANPRVAIKRLRSEFADNAQANLALAQEFCVLRHLAHPGVVRVFDLHREPFGLCCSMELLAGQTMLEKLHDSPAGFGSAVLPFGRELFNVLSFLHALGIVHGDIKPSNVFMASEGRTVLVDFNVAKATALAGAACSPVTTGLREHLHLPSYSLRYASPERLRGGSPSLADDIFAACCTVCEAAGGRHPFGQRSALEAIETGMLPEKPTAMPSRQWRIVRRGLGFEPCGRPSAEELLQAFSPAEGLLAVLKRCLSC